MEEVQKHSVHTLVFRSLKRSHDMFIHEFANPVPPDKESDNLRLAVKRRCEYGMIKDSQQPTVKTTQVPGGYISEARPPPKLALTSGEQGKAETKDSDLKNKPTDQTLREIQSGGTKMLVPRKAHTMPKPSWHAPWKLTRVISGHGGWVRCIAVDPSNSWFVTGSGDRVIKIWDLASGTLKLSLTGHVSTVRGVAVSARHPYLFSCSEDKTVKCWDLEQNKVIRHYHGHLSAVYCIDLHPTIDILSTCGRDGVCRVWDMRSKASIHTLTGHTSTVSEVRSQAVDPQIITASHDSTIRLWDLAAGRTLSTLTNHKKSVRALALHPTQFTFASASPDNIKMWKFPDGNFIQNLSGHNSIVNSLAVNEDGVLVSAGDNGSLHFWDWRSGYNFQRTVATAQPGSIDCENGIFQVTYDRSGSRLLTAEADKTIKIYKEDETATEESHPISWRPDILRKKKY